MARNYSKGTYTVNEIAEIVFKKCPGRFKDVGIAHRQVNKMMQKLGIKDINGKRRCMLITATDTARLVDAIVNSRTRKTKKPGEQIGLAEFMTQKNPTEWADPYTPHAKKDEEEEPEELPVPKGFNAEQVAAVADLARAWKRAVEAFTED